MSIYFSLTEAPLDTFWMAVSVADAPQTSSYHPTWPLTEENWQQQRLQGERRALRAACPVLRGTYEILLNF